LLISRALCKNVTIHFGHKTSSKYDNLHSEYENTSSECVNEWSEYVEERSECVGEHSESLGEGSDSFGEPTKSLGEGSKSMGKESGDKSRGSDPAQRHCASRSGDIPVAVKTTRAAALQNGRPTAAGSDVPGAECALSGRWGSRRQECRRSLRGVIPCRRGLLLLRLLRLLRLASAAGASTLRERVRETLLNPGHCWKQRFPGAGVKV